MFNRKLAAVVGLTVLLGLCASASAGVLGTLDVRYFAEGANRLVTNEGDLDGDTTYESSAYGSSGAYWLKTKNPTGQGALLPAPNLWAFCIEPDQDTSALFETYEVRPLEDGPLGTTWLAAALTSTQADQLRELWGRFFNPAWTLPGYPDSENDNAAGFGAALKEVIYESTSNPLDLTAGRFRLSAADGTVATIANAYLTQLEGEPEYFADLRLLTNDEYQDYIVQVPEPAALLLLASGLALLLRRR